MMRRILLPVTCLCFLVLGGCDGASLVCPLDLAFVAEPGEAVLAVGESADLRIYRVTCGGRDRAVVDHRFINWASSDSAIVVVNESGRVTGVAPGTAFVEATDAGEPPDIGLIVVPVEVLP